MTPGLTPLLFLPMALLGCATQPSRAGDASHATPSSIPVDVVLIGGHSYVIEPVDSPEGDGSGGPWMREWEYCEIDWYLRNDNRGAWGAIRAMLWPTRSAVGSPRTRTPVWTEHPGESLRRWTFHLDPGSFARMRAWLESQRADPLPGYPGWFIGRRPYHLFHHCHHFTAGALREAGFPVIPWHCLWGGLLAAELDRATRHAHHASTGDASRPIHAAPGGG